MDAGIASAEKPCPEPVEGIAWLIKRSYPFGSAQDMLYLVVSRERYVKDPGGQDNAVLVRETERNNVAIYREIDAETGETRLYCHFEQKAKKEQDLRNRFHVRLEAALETPYDYLADS